MIQIVYQIVQFSKAQKHKNTVSRVFVKTYLPRSGTIAGHNLLPSRLLDKKV